MGFIYSKPLSIEGVFSKFDTNGNGRISKEEAKAAKNTDIFTSFKVKNGMTLEKFENTNKDVYAQYEKCATLAYNKQQGNVKQWLEMTQASLKNLQDYELAELERIEKELEAELENLKQEIELKRIEKEIEDELEKLEQEIGLKAEREKFIEEMRIPRGFFNWK